MDKCPTNNTRKKAIENFPKSVSKFSQKIFLIKSAFYDIGGLEVLMSNITTNAVNSNPYDSGSGGTTGTVKLSNDGVFQTVTQPEFRQRVAAFVAYDLEALASFIDAFVVQQRAKPLGYNFSLTQITYVPVDAGGKLGALVTYFGQP